MAKSEFVGYFASVCVLLILASVLTTLRSQSRVMSNSEVQLIYGGDCQMLDQITECNLGGGGCGLSGDGNAFTLTPYTCAGTSDVYSCKSTPSFKTHAGGRSEVTNFYGSLQGQTCATVTVAGCNQNTYGGVHNFTVASCNFIASHDPCFDDHSPPCAYNSDLGSWYKPSGIYASADCVYLVGGLDAYTSPSTSSSLANPICFCCQTYKIAVDPVVVSCGGYSGVNWCIA